MQSKKYREAKDLRQAISARLKRIAADEGISVIRLRRHLAFERLLARLFKSPIPPWVLKGGYAMELRLQKSRATKDIDLAMSDEVIANLKKEELLSSLQKKLYNALSVDLGDFFSFEVRRDTLSLLGPPYGGSRFFVNAVLGGRSFARFHIDIGVGDIKMLPTEQLACKNLLAFAGIGCPLFPAIRREQQFAEKLHAYTSLRNGQVGSRVKDLIDMVLLIQNIGMDTKKLVSALRQTFERRNTHSLPQELPSPPQEWIIKFADLAAECHLELKLEEAYIIVKDYYTHIGAS